MIPMRWRSRLGLLVLALMAGCTGEEHPRPPIVVIVVDTLRADHLSQYGYERATSRALDAFASHATRFTSCYAPAGWTTPSTASIFTGLLPVHHGVHARGGALPAEAVTVPELLHEAAWRTVGISFNHNITRTTGFQQGFESFEGYEGDSGEYPDISTMGAAVARLEIDPDRPLFLYLQPMNTHGPYRVPPQHAADLLGATPDTSFRYDKGVMRKIMKDGALELRAAMDPTYLEDHRDQYDTAIRYSTDQIALMLDELEHSGVWHESLIIITSDHGEELYEHGGFGHGSSLHRELLHVPLWIKMPGQTTPKVVEDRVSLTDLLPTILEVAGLAAPPGLDGRSLLPLLNGDSGPFEGPPPELSETRWPRRFVGAALVSWPWKLTHVVDNYEGLSDSYLLHDLEGDPFEQRDVAAEHPEIVDRLTRSLRGHLKSGQRLPTASAEDRMNMEALRSLGYLDEPTER